MKKIIIIGSGISGLSCAIDLAENGHSVVLISPFPSERSQSVMAEGGINAALNTKGENDTPLIHMQDTLKGGCLIGNKKAVEGLCSHAPKIISELEQLGVVFSRDEKQQIDLRAFGGQTNRRTAFSGTSTGKQIVSALTRKVRQYEAKGSVTRVLWHHFLSAVVEDGVCYGAILYDEKTGKTEVEYGDAVVLAVGGQNRLFGKTTGSMLCDGSAAAAVFMQGAKLKNLEFIQYHPTTIETANKRLLISEAARGEGGRLFYNEGGKRVYFMEEKYGERGNLMPRDIVSKEIYDIEAQVYLDVAFLGEKLIHTKLPEIYEVCRTYLNLDITREPIPVYPSVHFFMGGLSVNNRHQTTIMNLYAIGECASIYHGANRLGGNSLLAAMYSGRVAAHYAPLSETAEKPTGYFDAQVEYHRARMSSVSNEKSSFPSAYLMNEIAAAMKSGMGILRREETLLKGLEDIEFYNSIIDHIQFDGSITAYQNYVIKNLLVLAKATLLSALSRRESRGAHKRADYEGFEEAYECATVASYEDGEIVISFEAENAEAAEKGAQYDH